MAGLRPVWEFLAAPGRATIFQSFHWNLLALTMFAGREEPFVVCAKASNGVAVVQAAIRRSDATVRLLGEELFDYRGFLHQGDAYDERGFNTFTKCDHQGLEHRKIA